MWTCPEIKLLCDLYPHHGIKRVQQAIPAHSRRDIDGMIRKIGLRRVFEPKILPVNTGDLRRYLIAQSYFIRRNLAATE